MDRDRGLTRSRGEERVRREYAAEVGRMTASATARRALKAEKVPVLQRAWRCYTARFNLAWRREEARRAGLDQHAVTLQVFA